MEALPQRLARHGWLDLWRLGSTNATSKPGSQQLTSSLHESTNLRRMAADIRRSAVSAQALSSTWDYTDSANPDFGRMRLVSCLMYMSLTLTPDFRMVP